MKFNNLGKAVRTLQDIGLDDIDIAILYMVSYNNDLTITDIIYDCSDIACSATIHSRIKKKLQKAKLLKLEISEVDGRVKNVSKGAKFDVLEERLGGL